MRRAVPLALAVALCWSAPAAAHSNEDAVRFYEREGFSDFYVLLTRPIRGEETPG